MTSTNGHRNGSSRLIFPGVTLFLALIGFTVQWGVISARLDGVEKRLDELIVESRANHTTYSDLDRRVSRLEGRVDQ